MAAVAMPLLAVTVLHASTFIVGVLLAAAYLPWLVFGLPAGAWLDRLRPRRVMILCDIVSAALYASVPVAAWAGVLSLTQLLIVAFLAGSANVMFGTAYQVFLPSLVAPADLVEGNAKLQGSASAAALGGPGLAGLVAQAVGVVAAMLINAVSFAVSLACLLGIGEAGAQPAAPRVRGPIRRDVADGIKFVARDPYLARLGTFGMVGNFALTGFQALMVVFLVRVMHSDPLEVGFLAATLGVGGVCGALVAGTIGRKLGTARGLLLTTLCTLPFGLLIPAADPGPRLALYVVGVLLTAVGIAVANIIMATFRQAYSPPGMLGRVTATMRLLTVGTSPVGALFGGALGTAIGVRNALWIIFSIIAASGITLITRAFAESRDLPTRPAVVHD